MIDITRQSGRILLTEVESKKLLAAYGFQRSRRGHYQRGRGNQALFATIKHKIDVGSAQEHLVGSFIKEHSTKNAEIALLVADQFQRQGLGTKLLPRLIQFGRDELLQRLTGDLHVENQGMGEICRKLGFHLQYSIEEQVVKVELGL